MPPKYNGNQMTLPGRAERKAMLKELEEARKALQRGGGAGNPGFEEYAGKFEALDRLMDEFSELDPWGLPKELTADQKAALLAAMKETGAAGEAFLDEAKKKAEKDPSVKMNQGLPGLVGKLQGLLARDKSTLETYDPQAKPRSLPELMTDSRCRTIELGATQIEAMGGAQSSRIPMTLVNEKGEKRRGFLTKANSVDTLKLYQEGIDAAKKYATEAQKKQLDNLLATYRVKSKLNQRNKNAGSEVAVASLFGFFDKKTPLTKENLPTVLDNMGVRGQLPDAAYEAMLKSWKPLTGVSTAINTFELNLKDGDRLDTRNSAMSSVADLLGKPDILARSTDVKFTDGKGGVLQGTFMDFSKGLDLRTDKTHVHQFQQVSDTPFSRATQEDQRRHGMLLKSVADLQVVDFLSGNVDRHSGNLTYIADDEGRIIGVQGIDNDSSFGSFDPGEKSRLRLPGTGNMGVISESMKNKVMNMTSAMLKFSLRGKGLSEEQLDFAALRLKQLQLAIVKGKEHYKDKPIDPKGTGLAYDEGFLRTVPDAEFKDLSIDRLCDSKPVNKQGWRKNLFGEINHWVPGLVKSSRRKGVSFVPKDQRAGETDDLTKVDTTGKTLKEKLGKLTFKDFTDVASGASNYVNFKHNAERYNGKTNVDQLTNGTNGSRQFSNMVKAVKEFEQLKKHLDELKNSGMPMSGQKYRQYYKQMETALKNLDDTQGLYMQRKLKEKKLTDPTKLQGKNEYEQRRIKYAKDVGQFVTKVKKKFAALQDPDELLKDKDEVRAQEETESLDERKAAMDALRKLHEQKGLASPEQLRDALRSGSSEAQEIKDKFAQEQQKAADELAQKREEDALNAPVL